MQKIQLNIIPFTPVQTKLTFPFYGEKIINAAKIKWDKIFSEFPEGRNLLHKSYFCDFKPARADAVEKEIDVYNAISFTQQYFRHLIEEQTTAFRGKKSLVSINSIDAL